MPLQHSLLVVTSNQEKLADLNRRFIKLGLEVVAAPHPRNALCAASRREFEVALVDHELPETNGVELMRQLKSHVAGLRVVMMTNGDDTDQAHQLVAAGAFDCLLKSCPGSELERVVEEALESPADTSSQATSGAFERSSVDADRFAFC